MNKETNVQNEHVSQHISNEMLAEVPGNRDEIKALMQVKREAIANLENEIQELKRQWCLVSDEKQWFTEKIETVTYRENRKKVQVQKLIGRIHWKEDFKDEDTGQVITIERSQVVRVDGQWEW